jgi:hypothetical protein
MPKRSSKPRDLNALASAIVADSTADKSPEQVEAPQSEKNPHAVALGRMGGNKGGKARAKKLTAEQRSEIARRAAQARWSREES